MALGLVTPKGVEVFGEPQQIVLGWMERSVVLLRGGGMRGWGAEGGGRGGCWCYLGRFSPHWDRPLWDGPLGAVLGRSVEVRPYRQRTQLTAPLHLRPWELSPKPAADSLSG